MSRGGASPFLTWPGWPHLRLACWLTCSVGIWFWLVFAGADWFTAHRVTRMRVHFGAELGLPFLPAFTLLYMSIYVAFALAPFVLRTRRDLVRLAVTQSAVILLAGLGFLLIPAELAYAPPSDADLGIWKSLFHFADRLNLDYNLVPSLHVALSVVCLEIYGVHATPVGNALLRGWAIAIAASTLLTHQHHLVDAVTGYALGFGAVWLAGGSAHRPGEMEH